MDNTLDGFGWSMGLSLNDDRIYVADGLYNQILIFDKLENVFLETISLQERICSGHIHGIEIMYDKIFVVKENQNCIAIFDLDGKFLYEFGKKGDKQGEFNGVLGIKVSENQIFVIDSGNNRIQIFDLDGEFLDEISTNVNGITDSVPYNLDIYDDRVYVVDRNNSTILIFNLDWVLIEKIEVNPDISNSSLSGIDVNDEMIFVADAGANMITIFDLDGNRLVDFGKFGERFGEFNSPQSIVSDGDKIFVADASNHRIQIFILENIE